MARFRLVSSKLILRTPLFEVTHDRAVEPRGTEIDRRIVRHPGAVAVLALASQSRVLLVRQYRLPVRRHLWELPAGTREEGETALRTAKRELAEETGYEARSWTKLLEFYPSPGFCDERMTVFIAEELEAGSPTLQPYEKITTKWFEWQEALAMVGSGRLKDSKTIAALLYADRFFGSKV